MENIEIPYKQYQNNINIDNTDSNIQTFERICALRAFISTIAIAAQMEETCLSLMHELSNEKKFDVISQTIPIRSATDLDNKFYGKIYRKC